MTDPNRIDGPTWRNGVPVDGSTGRGQVLPQVRSLRMIAGAVTVVPVALAVVLLLIGGPEVRSAPLIPMLGGLVLAVVALLFINAIGFRAAPLVATAPTQDVSSVALQRFTALFFIRFALAELPAIGAFGLTFAFPPANGLAYLPSGVLSLALMLLYVRPDRSNVGRVERALDADGAASNLSSAFGF